MSSSIHWLHHFFKVQFLVLIQHTNLLLFFVFFVLHFLECVESKRGKGSIYPIHFKWKRFKGLRKPTSVRVLRVIVRLLTTDYIRKSFMYA